MYARSFIACNKQKQLTSATTAQLYPYDHYACHLCASPLVFHLEWGTNRPWFEHIRESLTDNGRQHCPYVHLERAEMKRIRLLRRYLPDARPLVRKTNWHCSGCDEDYHGERYCLNCRTDEHSTATSTN